jgi:hypothetical protein
MKSFSQFIKGSELNETIAAAKKYLFDNFRDQVDQVELGPDETGEEDSAETILRKKEGKWLRGNRDYQKILEIVGRNQGYVGPFVKFRFKDGAPISVGAEDNRPSLEKLFDLMKENPQAVSQLPMKIEEYAEMKREGATTGFIALWDDLGRISSRKKYKWIVDEIKGDLRQSVRRLSPEEIDRLFAAAKVIDDADSAAEIEPTDPTSNRKLLLKSSRRYRTGEDYLEFAESSAEGVSNLDIAEKVRTIRSFEPEAAALYNKNGILAMSIRTARAQKEICSNVSNWCINDWAWNTYAGKNPEDLQINVYDFNRSVNDVKFTVGTTIHKVREGEYKVVNSNDKANTYSTKMSDDPEEHFIKLGYPATLAKAIVDALPTESTIKAIVTDLKIESKTSKDLLTSVVFSSWKIDLDQRPEAIDPVLNIIEDRVSVEMSPKEIYDVYMEKGWVTVFSAKLFNLFFPNLSDDDRKEVLAEAYKTFKDYKEMVAYHGPDKYPLATAALRKGKEILRILKTGESIERS